MLPLLSHDLFQNILLNLLVLSIAINIPDNTSVMTQSMGLIGIKWGERLSQAGSYRWKELSHLFTLFDHIGKGKTLRGAGLYFSIKHQPA
jgi:hypothetical protein